MKYNRMKYNRKNVLTSEEKNIIYNYKKENPTIQQKDIALWFNQNYKKTIAQSTVSTILINNGIKSRNKNNTKRTRISDRFKNKVDKEYIKTNNITKDIAEDHVKKLVTFFMEQNGDFKNEIINLLNIFEAIKKV